MGKKKAKKKKPQVKKPAVKKERPVVDSLGEELERPKVEPKPEQKAVDKRPIMCGCGGGAESKIIYCPKCGRTWCDLCLRNCKSCPICDTKGV